MICQGFERVFTLLLADHYWTILAVMYFILVGGW